MNKRTLEYFQGCLIGGAIGDALGWPIEFLTYNDIIKDYGESGLTELELGKGLKAEITDDTQMTMFTAEGLLRARSRAVNKGICHMPTVIYFAYQRWLFTQGYEKKKDLDFIYDGWLLNIERLYASRAPGNACISSLLSDLKGTTERPINNSKGCGAVMRSAPFGLFLEKNEAFKIAIETAAFTHGHKTGQLAAGALAYMIASIIEGKDLIPSIFSAIEKLKEENGSHECITKLEEAVSLSQSEMEDFLSISTLGGGWIAEEALAIGVYCAIKHQNDFEKALIAAVNHSGDSDSTGSITGNILGAYCGMSGIPETWIFQTELVDELKILSSDLLTKYEDNSAWWQKYPGY